MIPSIWNDKTYKQFVKELEKLSELKYKEFNSKIIFTDYEMLGIRLPIIKRIVKDIIKTDYSQFLKLITSDYYELVLIEGLVICSIQDKNLFLKYFEPFMLKIDNWAISDTCISSKMKVILKNKDFFYEKSKDYLKESHEYVVRVGVLLLMTYYIDEDHIDEVLRLIDSVYREEYYINMAIAWLISLAFIKQRDKTLEYLKKNSLDKFTQNKAISKIRDSFRVSKEDKDLILQYKK